jgi:hypothetical protein
VLGKPGVDLVPGDALVDEWLRQPVSRGELQEGILEG